MPDRLWKAATSHLLAAALAALSVLPAHVTTPASAQEPILRRGDAVVTGFAGVTRPGADLPADIHPLDRTYIDTAGPTVRIFDLSRLGGGPQGQLADAPVRFRLGARDVGHVFGIAFDGDGRSGPANIYLTATSVHGLQLMAPGPDGRMGRVMTGRPGAVWMDGQFGVAGKGGPGSIWRVDGRTGAVSLFATITNADQENSGAGLGNIAFDPASRQLFVSDLETGLVWRLGLDGQIVDAYDHGAVGRAAAGLGMVPYDPQGRTDRTQESFNTEIPETWGFADPARRVWGLAIESGRLYYAVADGPKIWSVAIAPDGAFGTDARLEIDVTGTPAGHEASALMFDGAGVLYVAQRGARLGNYDYTAFSRPQEAMVLRYRWNERERKWGPAAEEYAIGLPPEHRATLGGVALNYGYDRFGTIDYGRCRQTLWTTGEHLRAGSDVVQVSAGGPRLVHGLQGNYKHRVRPDNEPPLEAWYVDNDGRFEDAEAYGHIGNVGILGPCEGGLQYTAAEVVVPVWVRGPNLVVEKQCYSGALGGKVRCVITVRNTGDAPAGGIVEIIDATRVLWGPGAGEIVTGIGYAGDGAEWTCGPAPSGEIVCSISGALLLPGTQRLIEVLVDSGPILVAGNLGFRNCVTLKHADGQGKACAEGGSGIVVTKTGPAECQPGIGCKFSLAITNTGKTAFNGEVLISDGMFAGGKPVETFIASISPPLGCAQAPQALPFSCQAALALGPGETRIHAIVVNMPAPGNYWAQNCFAVTDPWLAGNAPVLDKLLLPKQAKVAGEPPGSPSCTWVKVPGIAPQQKQAPITGLPPGESFVPIGLLPPSWTCPDGRAPLASGRCPCPLNAPYNPETGQCGWRQACWDKTRLRPDGTCCPWGSVWWSHIRACALPPSAGCPDVWRRAGDGSCCPKGTRWVNGACRDVVVSLPCGFGQIRTLDGQCITIGFPVPILPLPGRVHPCPDGRPRLANGNCPTIACPGGRPYNFKTGRCDVPIAQPVPGKGPLPVKCPGKLVPTAQGACVPPTIVPRLPAQPVTLPVAPVPGGGTVPPVVGLPKGPTPPVGGGSGQGAPPAIKCPGRLVPNDKGVCVPPGIGAAQPCPQGSFRAGPNAPCQPLAKSNLPVVTKPTVVQPKAPTVQPRPPVQPKPAVIQKQPAQKSGQPQVSKQPVPKRVAPQPSLQKKN